jgi:N-acetylneuraminic acid mutarotase
MTRRSFHALVLAAAAQLAIAMSASAQAPDGRWLNLAPYPQPTQEIGAAVVNGKLYILGGYGANAPGGLAGWFNEYDPATDKWTKKPDIPMPVHHQAMVGYNGKVYVFGGGIKHTPEGDNWFPTNRSWEYTPATNAWKELAPMPTRRGGGVAMLVGSKIYVIGGAGYHPGQTEEVSISATVGHRALNTNEVYDPATNTWETRMPMNVPRNHAGGGVVNGKIYMIGGRVGSSFVGASSNDSVEEYDPATDIWRVRTRMPFPRSGMAYATDGRYIYLLGGEYLDSEMVGVFRNLEAYDPVADRFYLLPPMTVPRHGFAGGIIGNRFHAVSGQLQSGTGGGGPGSTPAHEAFEITTKPAGATN